MDLFDYCNCESDYFPDSAPPPDFRSTDPMKYSIVMFESP